MQCCGKWWRLMATFLGAGGRYELWRGGLFFEGRRDRPEQEKTDSSFLPRIAASSARSTAHAFYTCTSWHFTPDTSLRLAVS